MEIIFNEILKWIVLYVSGYAVSVVFAYLLAIGWLNKFLDRVLKGDAEYTLKDILYMSLYSWVFIVSLIIILILNICDKIVDVAKNTHIPKVKWLDLDKPIKSKSKSISVPTKNVSKNIWN